MINFTDFLMLAGMFLLRFGVPALVVVGLGLLLKRLDARWEAEANEYAAKQAAERPAIQPEAPKPAERPATPARKPVETPQLPFIIPPAPIRDQRQQIAQPGMQAPVADAGRGVSRASAGSKVQCSAPQNAGQPCWQVRLNSEGKIPDECVTCEVFQRYPTM
jgi:hypothetical protein